MRQLPENQQTEARKLEVQANVPLDALYKCWHMYPRLDHGYYVADLITEMLGGGGSSRLYPGPGKRKKIIQPILNAIILVRLMQVCCTIEGKLVKGVKMEDAEKAIKKNWKS